MNQKPSSEPNQAPNVKSYALVDPVVKAPYLEFYKVTYSDKRAALDRKMKELIAISASLAFNCTNCLDGHIKKALKEGATREEISEAIAVTLGVAAAAVVDRSDLAGSRLGISWDNLPTSFPDEQPGANAAV